MDASTDTRGVNSEETGSLAEELARLCADAGQPAAGARCRELAGLVAGLGMEPEIVDAAAIHPAVQAGVLDLEAVKRRYPGPSAALCADLAQLTDMSPELHGQDPADFAPDQRLFEALLSFEPEPLERFVSDRWTPVPSIQAHFRSRSAILT